MLEIKGEMTEAGYMAIEQADIDSHILYCFEGKSAMLAVTLST